MTFQEAIAVLQDLIDNRVRVIDLEKELKIPKNNLSGFLSGSRNTPPKWQEVIIEYAQRVEKVRKPEPKILLPPPKKSAAAPKPKKTKAGNLPKATPPKALPPPGLSRSDQMKWFRQHNQTLQ